MKRILLFLTIISALNCVAQSPVKWKSGTIADKNFRLNHTGIIPDDKGNFICIGDSSKKPATYSPDGRFICRYDAGLKSIGKTLLPAYCNYESSIFTPGPGRTSDERKKVIFGDHYVFVAVKINKVEIVFFDPEGKDVLSETIEPSHAKGTLDTYNSLMVSNDQKFLIGIAVENINENQGNSGEFVIHTRIFNLNFDLVWSSSFALNDIGIVEKLGVSNKAQANKSSVVFKNISVHYTDDKRMVFACFAQNSASSGMKAGLFACIFDKPESQPKVLFAEMENHTVEGSAMISGNTVTFSGMVRKDRYNGSVQSVFSDVYFSSIDLASGKKTVKLFTLESLEKKLPQYEKTVDECLMPPGYLLPFSDGGTLYVSEMTPYRQYNSLRTNADYRAIILIKFTKTGEIDWMKVLNREIGISAYSANGLIGGDALSAKVFTAGSKIVLLYTDNDKNTESEKLIPGKTTELSLIAASINSDGQISKNIIHNARVNKINAVTSSIYKAENGKFYIQGEGQGSKSDELFYFGEFSIE
jgi:hypothetical protein